MSTFTLQKTGIEVSVTFQYIPYQVKCSDGRGRQPDSEVPCPTRGRGAGRGLHPSCRGEGSHPCSGPTPPLRQAVSLRECQTTLRIS